VHTSQACPLGRRYVLHLSSFNVQRIIHDIEPYPLFQWIIQALAKLQSWVVFLQGTDGIMQVSDPYDLVARSPPSAVSLSTNNSKLKILRVLQMLNSLCTREDEAKRARGTHRSLSSHSALQWLCFCIKLRKLPNREEGTRQFNLISYSILHGSSHWRDRRNVGPPIVGWTVHGPLGAT